MAFTPETLSIIVQPIGGEGMRFVSYKSDDSVSTLTGSGYFQDAASYGLRVHDLVFVSPVEGDFEPFILNVDAIDANGHASASVDETPSARVYATKAAAEAARVPGNVDTIETLNYATVGDGGGSVYHRVASDQGHDLQVQSADGAYFARPITPFNIFEVGAKGDGSADDTAAFETAAAAPHPWCVVPDGTFLMDGIEVTEADKRFDLSPTATIKLRTGKTTGDGIQPLFYVKSTAHRFRLSGGILDGNRASLKASFADQDWVWAGVWILNPNDTLLSDIKFQNFISHGFLVQGRRARGEKLTVVDSGKGSMIKRVYQGEFRGLVFDGCGNDSVNTYQHCNEWRDCEDTTWFGVAVRNFNPDATGREPTPCAITLERSRNLHFFGVDCRDFIGTSQTGRAVAFQADTIVGLHVTGLSSKNYTDGIVLNSCDRVFVDSFDLDGTYRDDNNFGITVTNSGVVESQTGVLTYNGRTPNASRMVQFANGSVRRFRDGATIRGAKVSLAETLIYGNTQDGIILDRGAVNGFFGGTPPMVASEVDLDSTVRIFNNGRAGVLCDEWQDLRINGARIFNNGQDTSKSATQRIGVGAFSAAGTQGKVFLHDCDLRDTQSFTLTDAASFEPGATDADNQKTIYVNDLSGIAEGQWLTLEGAAGSGSDITAKIIDIDVINYAVTVETASSATFSETGNIASLTGTFDTSGVAMTGTGSALLTETKPFAIVKASGEYRILRRVDSDTSAVLQSAFTSDLSGATVEIILIDVSGIPSQQYGERWPSGLTARSITTKGHRYNGNVSGAMSIGAYDLFGPGSEIVVSTAVAGSNLNTGGATTALISGIPAGVIPKAARANITTAITGTDGTATLEFRDGSGIHSALGDFAAYAKNTKLNAGSQDLRPMLTSGSLALRLNGGGDNVASAGAVRAEAVLEVPPLYEDLPDA